MTNLIPTAATFPRYPEFSQNIWFSITGFLVVLVVLVSLAAVTAAVGKRFKSARAPESAEPQVPADSAAVGEGERESEVEAAHLPFVIAAAVDTVLQGAPHRVVSAREVAEGDRSSS